MRDSVIEAIARAETDFQRAVLQEWGKRNPEPKQFSGGYLGPIDWIPTLCICSVCKTPSVIIPDEDIKPAKGFVLCPQCSQSQRPCVTNE